MRRMRKNTGIPTTVRGFIKQRYTGRYTGRQYRIRIKTRSSRVFVAGTRVRPNPLYALYQQKKGEDMRRFFKRLVIWNLLFFGVGQWLFGCSGKEEMLAYRTIGAATIKAQGELDKKWLELQKEQKEGVITVHPAPSQPPTITIVKKEEIGPVYTDELGEVPGVDGTTTTTTQIDHTAYAIQQLGAVALALAERTGGGTRGETGKTNTIPRIVYKMPEMPKNGPADIIRATGEALKVSGAIPAIVQGWLGWMAADTVQEVAKVPSHQGDYVSMESSFNPVRTTKTLLPGKE